MYNEIKNKLTMKFSNLNFFKNVFITLLFTNYNLQVKMQKRENTLITKSFNCIIIMLHINT